MKILSGDIGGTNSRLEVFEVQGREFRSIAEAKIQNAKTEGFEHLLSAFLQQQSFDDKIDLACLAVAGPVNNQRCRLTNLDWTLDAASLKARFEFQALHLLNDFVAIPYGVDLLGEEELACLQMGTPDPDGVRAFVGSGTGLGQAISVPGPTGLTVLASEAGHADFAPGSMSQLALLRHMRPQIGPVSNEALLSGAGLINIYTGLFDQGEGDLSETVDIASEDAPAQIVEAARRDEVLAVKSVAMFFDMLGSYLGNVALQTLPRGGLYLAGGMIPKMMDLMDPGRLLQAYLDKAKMQELLQAIPIHVILDERVARLGAARYARDLAAKA